jgi:hypothetical protein
MICYYSIIFKTELAEFGVGDDGGGAATGFV